MGDGLRMGDGARKDGAQVVYERGDIVGVVENGKLRRITGRAADKKQLD